MRDTVTIFVPEGYANSAEFLKDCGFQSLSVGPENVAAFNDGYAAGLEDRDDKLPRSTATNAEPVAGRLRMIKFVSSLRQHEIDLAVREELLKLIAAVSTAAPEPDAVTEARFLLDRLEELDDANDKDYVREFEGHVRPSMSRLRHLLPRNDRGGEAR